jgi:hypothetical protein
MLDAMAGHMRDLMREQVIGGRVTQRSLQSQTPMRMPHG